MILVCSFCKESFKSRHKKKYCSREHFILGVTGKRNLKNTGEKNQNWKGSDVGYTAIHDWVKWWLKKPSQCQRCNEDKPLDLANKSQKYLRDLSDWEWLCRRCHMETDGRLEAMRILRQKINAQKSVIRACLVCGHKMRVIVSRLKRDGGKYCSISCIGISKMKGSTMRSTPICPFCRRGNPKRDVEMTEDGGGNTATLGPVVFYRCGVCKSRLPIRSGRVKTFDGIGPSPMKVGKP